MIKIISLNVEWHKHVDKILPFLVKQKLEVVMLQEVFLMDVKLYSKNWT